ncbi:alpha/beta fold hydrolase [Nocardioides sp. CPCC 205120]|uniref:alpha/beta fold hydrolase n=1 Tax=Nocardioides sp. CPCC 205120 TaxID=3406462 RepID=UPI003B512297
MDETSEPLPRVVVVPGLGLDARSWAPVGERLGWPLAVRTLPGYGLPVPRGTDLAPAALAAGVVEALGGPGNGPPVVLAAHSSGCQVAAHAARLAPDRVAALVLVGPTTDPRARGWPALVRRWLATAAREDPRQVPGLARQYRRTGLGSMTRTMDAARRDDLPATLTQVTCPVLVVRGPHDRICPADWAAGLGRPVTLPRGAHMVVSTHGADVADAVVGFLTEERLA